MKLFAKRDKSTLIGAVIEIGSGSVLASVISSDSTKLHPDIVWSKRDFAVLEADFDFEHSIKSILTTLMNSFMTLDNEGRSGLREKTGQPGFDKLLISISAPWAHTISKVVEYERDEPFVITEDLIDSLAAEASKRTLEALKQADNAPNQGLSIITKAITDITGNGYQTQTPIGQSVQNLAVTQVSALADTLITGAVSDLCEKLFPNIDTERFSTMIIFQTIIKELYPTITEYCLVNLTYEATELAIVRNGVLQYSTHTNIGLNTIIRNLAIRLKTPEADAATLLKNLYQTNTLSSLSEKQQEALQLILQEYQSALEVLFHETGDSLSIPKIIFLHGSNEHEQFFDDVIALAAKAATSSTHTIHTITSELLLSLYNEEERKLMLSTGFESSLLMTAQFFHKQQLVD